MWRAFRELIKPSVYSCLLLPALAYPIARARERTIDSLRWTAIACLVLANLGWFVLASIGWPRYAFCAVALGAFLVARPAVELAFDERRRPDWVRHFAHPIAAVTAALLIVTLVLPLGMTLRDLAVASDDHAGDMAAYLDANVAPSALVETWEPEMGFLTDHRYHYPPPALLMTAVSARPGCGPADLYDFRSGGAPDYVLEGPFARLVGLYPTARLDGAYAPRASKGGYTLYQRLARRSGDPVAGSSPAPGALQKGPTCTTETVTR
jgi:hypothetical protein